MNTLPKIEASTKTPDTFAVGDKVVQALVTDTIGFVVLKVTAKTITIAAAEHGELVGRSFHKNPNFPVCYFGIGDAGTSGSVVRMNKLGRFQPFGGRPLRHAPLVDGVEVTSTDYSF